MNLLMHVCCAPCSIYCIETLRKEGIEPTLYWYNPNIHPYSEYMLRLDTLKKYCAMANVKLIIEDEYSLEEFCINVAGSRNIRCGTYCYPVRFKKTFEYAIEHGYDAVSTTLLYSIYQKHDLIKKIMTELSGQFGIEFLYRDFRYGYFEGHDKARELGLYMQKYCGCIFSEEDAAKGIGSKPIVPEGFVWPKKDSVQIKRINDNKKEFLDLLLEADPEEEAIDRYLDKSDMYALYKDGEVITVAVVQEIDKDTVEIKNLATRDEYRRKGYGRQILKNLFGNYKQKYKKMIVGTTENNIPYYIKLGFDTYERTEKDFFKKNYKNPVYDGGLECFDLYYYSKDLRNS